MMRFFLTIDYLIEQSLDGRDLIFDLDDTLYPEMDFLSLAYRNISKLVSEPEQSSVYYFLVNTFKNEGREKLLDKLCCHFKHENLTLEKCLSILRSTSCKGCLETYFWLKKFLHYTSVKRLRIITNGTVAQQQNKIASINWDATVIEVVYADMYAPKPDPTSFYQLKDWQILNSPIYVGDSFVDSKFAENVGIEFYNAKELLS